MGKYFIMDFYDEVKKGAGTFSIQRRDAQGNIDEYSFRCVIWELAVWYMVVTLDIMEPVA